MVSIIVPMKNSALYLNQCIDSLLVQSYSEFELLLVDNGSNDLTMEIAMSYMRDDRRVKVFTSESGAGAARNRGISEINVKSDYLFFLDSDDFFDNYMVEKMVLAAQQSSADIVICKAYRHNHLTKKNRIMDYQAAVLLPEEREHLYYTEDLCDVLYQTSVASPWAKMFSRKLICEYNIRFQNLHNSNDVSFVYLAMSLAKKIHYIAEPLLFYRTHHGSICQGGKEEYPLECLKAYTKLKEELLMFGLFDIYKKSFETLVFEGYKWNYNSLVDEKAKKIFEDSKSDFLKLVEGLKW